MRAFSLKLRAIFQQRRAEPDSHAGHFTAIITMGVPMPICSHAPEQKPEEEKSSPEWREPPGLLGEYVRRVKARAAAREEEDATVRFESAAAPHTSR
jgi:hypothetical protein